MGSSVPVLASRRLRGERGTAIITVSVLLFSFTFGTIIWLSRDVNRFVANESAAQSIAFQAARAGAQQVKTDTLRGGGGESVELDEDAARAEANRVATRLFKSYGLDGFISDPEFNLATATVTVTATVRDPYGAVSATGSAQARSGP